MGYERRDLCCNFFGGLNLGQLLCEFLMLSWDQCNFWSSLKLTLGKIPIIVKPHPLGLNGDLSLLKNRRSGRLSPRASAVARSYMDTKSEWYFLGKVAIGQEGGVLEIRFFRSAGVIVAPPLNALAVHDYELVVHYPSRRGNQPNRSSRLLQFVM